MESNLQEKITVTEIAGNLGVSRRQLGRLFATEIQTGPMAAYLAMRLHYARTLLGTSDLPIGEIAYRCGFPNAGHFSRVYRQHAGVAPSEFRRG